MPELFWVNAPAGGRLAVSTRPRGGLWLAVTMATPADGPSFGVAPSGTWTWISFLSNIDAGIPQSTDRERT